MVDAVVSFVVNKIGDYLIQEASILRGVKDEVYSLRNELALIRGFVKDAESQLVEGNNNTLREWVSQVRDIAYDIEDVLDTYIFRVQNKRQRKQKLRYYPSFKNYCCIVQTEANLYNIGKEIESLKRRMSDISRCRETYGITDVGGGMRRGKSKQLDRLRDLRRVQPMSKQGRFIGFEDDAKILRGKLLDGNLDRYVVSIYGMGGLGKTTLAKKLYNSDEVQNKFNCHAWIYVSQDYRAKDLLLKIINSFWSLNKDELEEINMKDIEQLETYIYEKLSGRKYLVVVDDVWEKEAWRSLSRAFPDDTNGSRVIVTTRIKDVAEHADEKTYLHKLRFMDSNESWELFCEKTFRSLGDASAEEREMGKEMVEKCRGLPLAIIVLGGLLSGKNVDEWQEVREHLWRHLEKDSIDVSNLLNLSFEDLQHELKLCFLYLGVFPEDSEIPTSLLIFLLIAEGFIPDIEGPMEKVAEEYLLELMDRSLIQADISRRGKISPTCRVHDLLRDLAVNKARELNFIHIHNKFSGSSSSLCRRHAIHDSVQRFLSDSNPNSRTRSLIHYPVDDDTEGIRNGINCERFKLLRVLVLNIDGIALPEEFGELIHLRFFRLVDVRCKHIPASINKLHNLQTLVLIIFQNSESLDFRKLTSLRHLIMAFKGDVLIDDAKCLRTFTGISWKTWSKIDPKELVELRQLWIDCTGEEVNVSFHSFGALSNLRVLHIDADTFVESSFEQLSQCRNLVEMSLRGRLKRFPESTQLFPRNLEHLILIVPGLEEDPMPALGKLPKLSYLVVAPAFRFGKMVCEANGFPRLETLNLLACTGLKELSVEEGAMPMLENLYTKLKGRRLKIPDYLLPTVKHDDRSSVVYGDPVYEREYWEEVSGTTPPAVY